jgi:hypothetical protein
MRPPYPVAPVRSGGEMVRGLGGEVVGLLKKASPVFNNLTT